MTVCQYHRVIATSIKFVSVRQKINIQVTAYSSVSQTLSHSLVPGPHLIERKNLLGRGLRKVENY